jgi:oligoribonuclease
MIDLTTLKELTKRWYPKIFYEQEGQNEDSMHRAMDDIKKSIEGMKIYREKIFIKD